jgi:hypothetical protein
MSSIGTGSTTSTDVTVAAAELVERAKAGLEGTPKLAILFATTQYDTEGLVSSVSELLGGRAALGRIFLNRRLPGRCLGDQ